MLCPSCFLEAQKCPRWLWGTGRKKASQGAQAGVCEHVCPPHWAPGEPPGEGHGSRGMSGWSRHARAPSFQEAGPRVMEVQSRGGTQAPPRLRATASISCPPKPCHPHPPGPPGQTWPRIAAGCGDRPTCLHHSGAFDGPQWGAGHSFLCG